MSLAVFRTDASLQIGTGHVMRCLTLADALREHGWECRFICRAHVGNLLTLIRQRGHEGHALPTVEVADAAEGADNADPPHAGWLGAHWRADAEQTRHAMGEGPVDWLIVDHYALDARWERQLRRACRKLMVIDDLADRDHDCDVLLDQNALPHWERRYAGRVPQNCVKLLGPSFILLRPGFARLARSTPMRTGHVRRALIAFAGSDSGNLTSTAITAVTNTLPLSSSIDVLIGEQHPARQAIVDACAARGFDLYIQVTDPAPLMARADLAIAASGFVSYELAALGVPALLAPISDIQRAVARTLAEAGVSLVVDYACDERVAAFRRAWISMVEDDAARTAMSRAGAALIDANGAARVVDNMLAMAN